MMMKDADETANSALDNNRYNKHFTVNVCVSMHVYVNTIECAHV